MRQGLLLIFGCLVGGPLLAAGPAASVFRAGAATSTITPPLGGAIVGNFTQMPANHVHDELHVRCLVLDDGRTRLAVAVCDVLGISRDVSLEARRLIEANSGIPPDRVLICAVHTHSACDARGQAPLNEYNRFVARRIADGVQCAANRLRPAEMAVVSAEVPQHVFNRRWLMKPGTVPPNPFGGIDRVKMNPPPGSPDLVEPAGPTDPTVSVLAFREPGGRPIAVFSAYGLHYIGGVRGSDISADYFGMYCEELARLMDARDLDPPLVVMMANGASGDVTGTDRRQPQPKLEPYEKMRRVAGDIARAVHAALDSAQYGAAVTLAACYREPLIATRRPTAEQMAWARRTLDQPAPPAGKEDLPRIYAGRLLWVEKLPEKVPAPLHAMRIGPVCLGSMPIEVFCEVGLEFKRRCPLERAILVSLAHDYLGYLPTPRHFELGGYETWLGTSRLEPQASERMLEELLGMAAGLVSGK